MYRRALFAALCAIPAVSLFVSAGCGGGGGGGGGCDQSQPTSLCGSDPTTLTVSGTTPQGLTATLTQSQATITGSGATENYTLTLKNNTSASIQVVTYFDSTGTVALVPGGVTIVDSLGTQVYPLQGAGTPPLPTTVTLAPGQSLTTTNEFSFSPGHVGRYRATANFSFNGHSTNVGPLTFTDR